MAHHQEKAFRPAAVAVITVSDTRTLETDTSGDLIESRLREAGHKVVYRNLVIDDQEVIRSEVVSQLDARNCSFIIITGGTGLSHRDVTPEAIQPLYTKHIPGFGELFRYFSIEDVGTATLQSRADAGLCGHVVVMALPGSTGACAMGMDRIILPQLDNRQRPCNFRSVVADPE